VVSKHKVMLTKVENGERVGPMFHAHVGPIHSLLLRDDLGLLFTGSYDTTARCAHRPLLLRQPPARGTVRACCACSKWDVASGRCLKIFQGHMDTVRILARLRSLYSRVQ
jgi:hypothetical protein